MALSNPLEAFVWGPGGSQMTPEQVARQREIAAALTQGSMDYSPVGHWLQGAARAAQGLAGGLKERWANEAENAGRSGFQQRWDSAFGGGQPTQVASLDPVASALAGSGAGIQAGDNAQAIRQGLIDRGLPEHVADAFMLNFQDESGLNPGINEQAPLVPGSRGGFGLAQWTGDRRNALEQFAVGRNANVADPNVQLDFLMQELQGPEAKAYQTIMGAPDMGSAAAAIVNNFLRPAEANRSRREAAYLGGRAAPAQVAQAGQGAGPDMASLLGLASDPWANDAQRSIVNALFGQQLKQQDPAYQQQLRQGDLDYARGQFEFDQLRNAPPPLPGAPKTEKMYDPDTGREQVMQWNANSGEWTPLGGVAAPKEPLVQVNTGDGVPGLGKLSNDYSYIIDPETGKPRIDPTTGLPTAAAVPGSPAAIAAQQAAHAATAQEGAKLTSDVEKADTVLSATRSVLDLLDNSSQPTTGTLSRPFAMYSGTPAGKIRSYVSTLQSGVALGAMQRLKEMSATGATGFGALNKEELNILISDIGALDPDTTEPEIFRDTVRRIEDRSKRIVDDIKRNVSPERIQELGLQGLIDAFATDGSSPPGVVDFSDYFK